jgi:hypothetical protein
VSRSTGLGAHAARPPSRPKHGGGARRAGPLVLVSLAVAAAWVPPLVARLPVLGVLRGALGFALLAAGLIAALLRGFPLTARLVALSPRALFALSTALFVGAGLHYVRGIQATGDEVEYLMLTQSLWREHDLDLEDNFARGDHLEYTPGMGAMPFGTFRQDGRPISTHSPGLPFVLAPVYALGGRTACVVFLALLASWLALEVRALALRVTGDREAALLAWLACVGPPAFFYSFHVYTEIPTALGVALALRLLLASPGPWGAAGAALAVAALPWMHVKMIPAAAVLGVLALVRLRGRGRLAFVAVALLMAGAYAHHYWRVFGDPTPLALYGSRVPKKIKRADPREALPGLVFDSSYGLLPNAPVFVLSLAGLVALRRRRGAASSDAAPDAHGRAPDTLRRGAVPFASASGVAGARTHVTALTAVGLATLLPLIAWQTWWAGHCPPARFLVPLVPWLAVLAVARVAASCAGLVRWRWGLALGGLALGVFMSLHPHDHLMLNNPSEPTHVWEALAGSPEPGVQPGTTASLGRYLPRLISGAAADVRVAVVWGLALLLLLALDALAQRSERADRLFSGPGLALALLLVVGIAVDGWARRGLP